MCIRDSYEYYPYKLSLEELADREHLNKDYLSHMFSRYTGQSFKNLLNMVRAEMSERRLLSSSISITPVSYTHLLESYSMCRREPHEDASPADFDPAKTPEFHH